MHDNDNNKSKYKPKIIVVEDELIILKDTMHKLKSIGYEAEEGVSTGEDLLESIKKSKPDLVIMDIRIEGEMDGIELANKIIDEYSIQVIFLTSHSDSKTFSRAVGVKPDNYLIKPISETELKAAIEMSLFQKRTENR